MLEAFIQIARDRVVELARDLCQWIFSPLKSENWECCQIQWNEKARDAAAKSLYYLGLVEPHSEIGRLRWAFEQVRIEFDVVAVRDDCPKNPDALPEEEARDFEEVRNQWKSIASKLADPQVSPDYALLSAIRRDVVAFLRKSTPNFWISLVYVWVPHLTMLVARHFGRLFAMTVALVLCLRVDLIRSLLENLPANELRGLLLLVALPWLVISVALPIAALPYRHGFKNRILSWVCRKGIDFFDVGGRPFRTLIPLRGGAEWRRQERKYARALFVARWQKLAWTVGLSVGMILWTQAFSPFTEARLTVFIVLALLSALVLFFGALDFWDFHTQAPLRAVAVISLLVGVAVYLTWPQVPQLSVPVAVAAGAAPLAVISWKLKWRMLRPAALLGLVVVSALFAWWRHREAFAQVWRDPEFAHSVNSTANAETPSLPWPYPGLEPVVVIAASGGGSRAAVFTGEILTHLNSPHFLNGTVGHNIQAISSVSGGSLATAIHVADRYNSDVREVASRVGRDYLRSVLVGLILYGRGKAIEQDWEQIGLGDVTIKKLRDEWLKYTKGSLSLTESPEVPPFPIPMFNSATMDGNIVVITPFARKQYLVNYLDEEARNLNGRKNQYAEVHPSETPTKVLYRSGMYGLDDFLNIYDPPLSAAVRASANFPFGFPLVEIQTTKILHYSPRRKDREPGPLKRVYLTDGGAVSNSGVWPLYHLLMNEALIPELRSRGVLLIVVDAAKMPSADREPPLVMLAESLVDNAAYGEALHWAMFQRLETVYGDRLERVVLSNIARESFNVHTTWTLDDASRRKVRGAAGTVWREQAACIEAAWTRLRTPKSTSSDSTTNGYNDRNTCLTSRVPLR